MTNSRERAETLAIQALAWLAAQEDLFPVFLGASGASPAEVAQRAAEAEFLAAVLDFVLMDDAWVVGFCDAAGHPYTAPLQARALLPGGTGPNWT